MNNLIFIGTLHNGFTPKDEFIKIINSFHPHVLLVEIAQQDIESGHIKDYPTEMQAALQWGNDTHLRVCGFDANIDPIKEGTSKEELKKVDKEQLKIIKGHSWKDFNNPSLEKTLSTPSWDQIINVKQWSKREQVMYQNILDHIHAAEITVVITGCGHIPFFKSKFPSAQFPLS